jgi:hypothetical protein
MVESNDLIYFHVIQPTKVGYVFKTRPAQDFGDLFVSYWVVPEKIHTPPTEEISAVRRGRGRQNCF